jgi:hypothetical protein
MSPFKAQGGARSALLAIAIAASASLSAAERHNIVLLVPEVLSAASADNGSAPALASLRDEGVNFVESHSRFPPLAIDDDTIAAEFNKDALIEVAVAAQYSAVFLENIEVHPIVTEKLRSLEQSRPFSSRVSRAA